MLAKERYLPCFCFLVLLASGVQSASTNVTVKEPSKSMKDLLSDLTKASSSGGSQGPWLPIFPSASTLSRRISGVTSSKKIESKETFITSSSGPAPSIYNNIRSDVTPQMLRDATIQQPFVSQLQQIDPHRIPNNQYKSQIVRGSYSLGPSQRGIVTNVQITNPGSLSQHTSTKSAYDTSSMPFSTRNLQISSEQSQPRVNVNQQQNVERLVHKSGGANYAQPQSNVESFSGRQLQSMIYANHKNIPAQQSNEKFLSSEKVIIPLGVNNNNNNDYSEKNLAFREQLSRHSNFPQQLSIRSFVQSIQMPKSFQHIENYGGSETRSNFEPHQTKTPIRAEQKSINADYFDRQLVGKSFPDGNNFAQQQQQFNNEKNEGGNVNRDNYMSTHFNARSFSEPQTVERHFSVSAQQNREFQRPETSKNFEQIQMNRPYEEKFMMPLVQEPRIINREFSEFQAIVPNFQQPQNRQPEFNEKQTNQQFNDFRISGNQAEEFNHQPSRANANQVQFQNFAAPQPISMEHHHQQQQQQQQSVQSNNNAHFLPNSNAVEVFNKIESNIDYAKTSGLGEHSIIGGGFTDKAVAVINEGNNFNSNFEQGKRDEGSSINPETHFYIMPSNNEFHQEEVNSIQFDGNSGFERHQNAFQNNFNPGFENSQRISVNSVNQQVYNNDDRSSMQGGHTNNLNHIALNGESLYRGNLADKNFDEFGRSISPRTSFAATKPFQHINIHSGYLGFRPGTIYSRVYPSQSHKKST